MQGRRVKDDFDLYTIGTVQISDPRGGYTKLFSNSVHVWS
jgi:hypothetical protein